MLSPKTFYGNPVIINDFTSGDSRFQDFVKKCCPKLECKHSSAGYTSLEEFCEDLELARNAGLGSITPRWEHLSILLFLQNRDPEETDFLIQKPIRELNHVEWKSLTKTRKT